jgi:hypothetical protein
MLDQNLPDRHTSKLHPIKTHQIETISKTKQKQKQNTKTPPHTKKSSRLSSIALFNVKRSTMAHVTVQIAFRLSIASASASAAAPEERKDRFHHNLVPRAPIVPKPISSNTLTTKEHFDIVKIVYPVAKDSEN